MLDTPTQVFVCEACWHAQSPDLPDLQRFYDSEYQISLDSEDHDQLYAVEDGKIIYRTDWQAQVALDLLYLPFGASLLDFGAAKAKTLKSLTLQRRDIQPFVFDVSDSYRNSWSWLPEDHTATHTIPDDWENRFDAVTAHFVIEHVAEPVRAIADMARLLKPTGQLFLSVPDPVANPGDLIVVDHINHFSVASLCSAVRRAGLAVERLETDAIKAAIVLIARKIGTADTFSDKAPEALPPPFQSICATWVKARETLAAEATHLAGKCVAIYGAGFYGAWIYSQIAHVTKVECFLDNNPHLQGTTLLGAPVITPTAAPDYLQYILVGLNPRHARAIIESQPIGQRASVEFIYPTITK